jgi:hypothetical protein
MRHKEMDMTTGDRPRIHALLAERAELAVDLRALLDVARRPICAWRFTRSTTCSSAWTTSPGSRRGGPWPMPEPALSERQRAYLLAIFAVDQEWEEYERAVWSRVAGAGRPR